MRARGRLDGFPDLGRAKRRMSSVDLLAVVNVAEVEQAREQFVLRSGLAVDLEASPEVDALDDVVGRGHDVGIADLGEGHDVLALDLLLKDVAVAAAEEVTDGLARLELPGGWRAY